MVEHPGPPPTRDARSEAGSAGAALLEPDEPPAFEIANAGGASRFVLVCDHASNRVPRRLGTLGLDAAELERHIAWDPGAGAVARRVAAALDAPLVSSGYSRLVIDCNRPLESEQSIAERSDGVVVPANRNLPPRERKARVDALFSPYHDAVERLLDARRERASLLLAIHSFTPVLSGRARPWHFGVSGGRVGRLGAHLVDALAARGDDLTLGVDEPYAIDETIDYTIPVHGDARGLPCALVEIRQDGIRTSAGVEHFADRLAEAARRIEREAPLAFRDPR